jgi:Zn-dependent M28 family amino/carboxypeptidase
MRAIISAAALALAAASAVQAAEIEAARISRHTEVLASDAFEGRGPATPGEEKTVAYLIEQFRAAGLSPGGDPGAGGARGWTQAVPLARFENKADPKLTVRTPTGEAAWKQGEDVAIRAAQTGQTAVDFKDAPVVFAGYGVTAPERGWDDFKGVDVKGKVILVLVNDPDFETGQGPFGGKAMTWYGRWPYKYEEAAKRGAVGALIIHETAPASYGWATVKNSNVIPVFDIVRSDPTRFHPPLEGWIQRDVAAALMKAGGLDLETLKTQAQGRDFKPAELKGVTLSAEMSVDAQQIVSKNVVALLPGAAKPDETVIYTAHWDHLGIGPADANGDAIYNGALDNASGTAALLELGRVIAAGPKPRRSVVFLAVTAEEKGLLGSEYYAANPLYPLGKTVANINMDGLPLAGPARNVGEIGLGNGDIDKWLAQAAARHKLTVTGDPRPEAGTFYRSDHFSLAKRGVPALYAKGGEDLVKGGLEAGRAASADYNTKRYHQPDDEWSAGWDLSGAVLYVQLLREVGEALANSSDWPQWSPTAEFKAERDKTADQRK